VVPVYSFLLVVVTFSSIGLPGMNGFVGELLVLLGSFGPHPVATSFAATGVILGAVYMLWMVQRVVFGPLTHHENKKLEDINGAELTYMVPLIALIFLMGLFPGPILSKMAPSIDRVLVEMDAAERVFLLADTTASGQEHTTASGQEHTTASGQEHSAAPGEN
jgi:NADH-quinone oxidoreductase subunit M